jgi:hypothetical protein
VHHNGHHMHCGFLRNGDVLRIGNTIVCYRHSNLIRPENLRHEIL